MNFVFFLSFTEGEQWICRTFSDIGKRQFNVEFLSHSPFRKINSERMFFCRVQVLKWGLDTKAKITGSEWQTVTKATTYHFIASGILRGDHMVFRWTVRGSVSHEQTFRGTVENRVFLFYFIFFPFTPIPFFRTSPRMLHSPDRGQSFKFNW